jgi:hypothetical protein
MSAAVQMPMAQVVQLSGAALLVIALLAALELGLDVVALVHLYRTPTAQVVGGNKWVWVAVIILVNLLGAILYLAIGHRPPPAPEIPAGRSATSASDAMDSLYGSSGQPPTP